MLLDNLGGARRAVEHLIAHGHTRIACVADTADLYTVRERLTGYREALEAAGLEEDPLLIASGNHDASAAQASGRAPARAPRRDAGRPRSSPPTTATRSARCTRSPAARPVALVGFDDFELADLLGTTVVRADPWRLGDQAAALAFARLDGDNRPPLEITVPTELIVRGSGEVAQ